MLQRSSVIGLGLGVAVLTLLATAPADAAQSKCLASKIKCVSNKAGGLLKCHQLALTPGKPTDQSACLAKAMAKFDGGATPAKGCFEKLESKVGNDCITFDDTASVESAVDSCVGAFVAAVDVPPPPPTQSKCNAGKIKCIANKAKGLLKCYQKAATPGKPANPNDKSCIDKVQAKFEDPTKGCFAKLEQKLGVDCETLGNAAAVELLIDNCVQALVDDVDPPPTTTTSVSTTTSSSVSTTTSSSVSTTTSSSIATTTSSSTTTTSSSTTTTTSSSTTTTSSSTTTTSSSTTTTSSSSTTTTSSSSTTTTTSSTTTTSIGFIPPTALDFTVTTGGGQCGEARDGINITGNVTDTLSCGGLNLGGGNGNTVAEGITPSGTTNRFAITGCVGNNCTLGGTPLASATATRDCTSTNCFFGTPLPIPNGGQTTCVVNRFASNATGNIDISTGVITNLGISLSSDIRVTGAANVAQPCPICTVAGTPSPTNPLVGTCDRGARIGLSCTTTNPQKLSKDCAAGGADGSISAGIIAVNLTPLTTGTAQQSNATGAFCPSQTTVGCFGSGACRSFREIGLPAGTLLPVGTTKNIKLASTFCIPATTSALVNFAAKLPGPGALSLVGDMTLIP